VIGNPLPAESPDEVARANLRLDFRGTFGGRRGVVLSGKRQGEGEDRSGGEQARDHGFAMARERVRVKRPNPIAGTTRRRA
jgi:hypothetical protein